MKIITEYVDINNLNVKGNEKNIRKIDCNEYKIKQLEEILAQQNLFTKDTIFIIENFDNLVENNNPQKVIELLNKTQNINLIIKLEGGLNKIKNEQIKNYLKANFKIENLEQNLEIINNFIKVILEKYNINPNFKETIMKILKKTNFDFLITERILEEIIFSQKFTDLTDSNTEINIDNIPDDTINLLVSQYKEFNLFNVVNIFLELALDKEKNSRNYNYLYELMLSYLEELELENRLEELWGLIFSQITALIKIYEEYCKIGENYKAISHNIKMNEYRVKMLIKYIRKLDYLIKHKNFSIVNLLSTFLKSEINIKTNQSNIKQELLNFII